MPAFFFKSKDIGQFLIDMNSKNSQKKINQNSKNKTEKCYVYIIDKGKKMYCGITKDIIKRLMQHNKIAMLKSKQPIIIKWLFQCENRKEAAKLEKKIKKKGVKKFLLLLKFGKESSKNEMEKPIS